jgi:NADH-quinone oxidoreductase subunit J
VNGAEVAFTALGAVALVSAVLVVTTGALVRAALWLVVAFGAIAGCFLVLTAELLAWVQILVYVGAIVVLLLFGIMLTRAPIGRSADLDSGNRPAALVVALGVAGTLVPVLVAGFGSSMINVGGVPAGGAATVGTSLFGYWVLPFEVLSVLLLAALVGAIVLSRSGAVPTVVERVAVRAAELVGRR